MSLRRWFGPCAVMLCCLMQATHARADAKSVALALEAQLNALETGKPEVRGLAIAWPDLLHAFYAQRAFAQVWNRAGASTDLLRAIRASYEEGLDPEDYYLTPLSALVQQVSGQDVGDTARAELELLSSEALLRLCYHLSFGKVDAASFDPQWNYGRSLAPEFPLIERIEKVVAAQDLFERIEALTPKHALYVHLRRELARHRVIAETGGFRVIPAGPSLAEGAVDERVALLRARLVATEDAPPVAAGQAQHFDATLSAGVRDYQARLGLPATGSVDAKTLAELNVPVSARIDQLRVNLDRGRVLLQDLPQDFVVVNVAAFEAYLVRAGKRVWSARVQVGKPLRRTPIFRSTLSYLVLNPNWTVPPSILEQDILPEARKSAKAISRRNLKVYDRNGRELSPDRVPWRKLTADNFPYVLRQDPGPRNALGRVKLMFPNHYAIYIHDTPAQDLFEAGERNFSSGCVRVERPLELTELLLNDPATWGAARIAQVVASGETTHVSLPQKLPVLLVYWTAWVDDHERANFRRDPYGQDALWLKQLRGGFVVRQQPLLALRAE